MHVFTYGTLMFPEVWRKVVGREFTSAPATVSGYCIYRVAGALYPGIAAATAGDLVHGVVYFDVDQQSIERLDQFEDDFYRRQQLLVRGDDGRNTEAEAYVVPPELKHVLSQEPWRGADFAARGDLAHFLASFAGFERIVHQSP